MDSEAPASRSVMCSIAFFRFSSRAFRVLPWLLGDCRCDLLVGALQGKDGIIIIADLISSGTTILRTASACQAVATHALLTGNVPVVLTDDARQQVIVSATVASPGLSESRL